MVEGVDMVDIEVLVTVGDVLTVAIEEGDIDG